MFEWIQDRLKNNIFTQIGSGLQDQAGQLQPQTDPYQHSTIPGADVADPFGISNQKSIDTGNNQYGNTTANSSFPVPDVMPSSAAKSDPYAFTRVIAQMQDQLNKDASMNKTKNTLLKHMFDTPLSDEEKKALTPALRHAIDSNNIDRVASEIRAINDEVSGRRNTIDQAVKQVSDVWSQQETARQDIMKTISSNPGAIDAINQSMPGYLESLGIGGGSINGYNIASYNPVNPNYSATVQSIYSTMPDNVGDYIARVAPNSPITGDMMNQVASQYGIDIKMLAAMMKLESNFGTSNVASVNNNYGGVTWNPNMGEDRKGSPRPGSEGGFYVKYNSPLEGLQAMAYEIARRKTGTTVKSDSQIMAQSLVDGSVAPSMISAYGGARNRAIADAIKLDPNYNPQNAELKFSAAKKWVTGMNSSQMIRYQGLAGSVVSTINEVSQLAQQMAQSGLQFYNKAKLEVISQTQGNTPAGQLAAQYLAAVNTLKEEFANLAQGGYAPTEAAWGLANSQINANYGVNQLQSSLTEVQRLINYRINALGNTSPVVPVQSGIGAVSSGPENDPLGIL